VVGAAGCPEEAAAASRRRRLPYETLSLLDVALANLTSRRIEVGLSVPSTLWSAAAWRRFGLSLITQFDPRLAM